MIVVIFLKLLCTSQDVMCIFELFLFYSCSKKREVVPDLAPMLWHSFGKKVLQKRCLVFQSVASCWCKVSFPGSDQSHPFNLYMVRVFDLWDY